MKHSEKKKKTSKSARQKKGTVQRVEIRRESEETGVISVQKKIYMYIYYIYNKINAEPKLSI